MAIGVLGPLTVDGAEALGPRERVVLQALASKPGASVSSDSLADALWGADVPRTGSKVVQGCVHRLRKALGQELIRTTTSGYRLEVPLELLDSVRFERLLVRVRDHLAEGDPERAAFVAGEALALWRGPALPDLENWEPGRIEAIRLNALRMDLEELRVEAEVGIGHARQIAAEARSLVVQAPFREHRWALLARALYLSGRQGDALEVLQTARARLRRELGLDPGVELVELEQRILRQDEKLAVSPAPRDPIAPCPWRGLLPYEADDAQDFFGRTAELEECLDRLSRRGVLVIVARSGAGKSSLVRAGIAAAVAAAGREVLVTTPGTNPLDSLPERAQGPVSTLVVDQAEEAVTLCRDPGQRDEYFRRLASYDGPLVLTIRADHLTDLSAHVELARIIEEGLYLLPAMSDEALRQVIEGPARQSGLRFEGGLTELILRDVEGEPGGLPLLSHVLRQTWERREGRVLGVEAYRLTGGVRHAVAQSAEALFEQCSSTERDLLRALMLRLVALGDNGEPVRTRVSSRVVVASPAQVRLVERLVAARLVTSGDGELQLSHEAVARSWPRLRGWLQDDREGQTVFRHLAAEAQLWDGSGRPESDLYRGARLERATQWAERSGAGLTQVELDYLSASRQHEASEQQAAAARERTRVRGRRRWRVALGVLITLVITSLVAASLVHLQSGRARAARSEAAAAARVADARRLGSLAATATDPSEALLLAAEAVRRDDVDANREQLLEVLGRHSALLASVDPYPVGVERARWKVDDDETLLAVSPDGRVVAAGATDRGVHLLDATTLRPMSTLPRPAAGQVEFLSTELLAVSPNRRNPLSGHFLANGTLSLVDLAGARSPALGGQPGRSRIDAIGAGGHFVVVGYQRLHPDRTWPTFLRADLDAAGAPVQVWDLRSPGRPLAVLSAPGSPVFVDVSADGHRLLVIREQTDRVTVHDLASGAAHSVRLRGAPAFPRLPGIAALSPDERTLAVAGGNEVMLLDARTLRRLGTLPAKVEVQALSFSPSGDLLAAGLSGAGAVAVWDVGSRQQVHTLAVGGSMVWSTAFGPDGRLYISGESGIRILEPDGGRRVLTRADGTRIGYSGSTGKVYLWDSGAAWVRLACAAAGRDLTGEEWTAAFGAEPYRRTCPEPG